MSRKTLTDILETEVPVIKGKNIYIWGTGNTALLYQEGIKRLEKEGFFQISGYCDNNSEKWGKKFCGKLVIAPDDLADLEDVCVLICSAQQRVCKEIRKQLDNFSRGGGRKLCA